MEMDKKQKLKELKEAITWNFDGVANVTSCDIDNKNDLIREFDSLIGTLENMKKFIKNNDFHNFYKEWEKHFSVDFIYEIADKDNHQLIEINRDLLLKAKEEILRDFDIQELLNSNNLGYLNDDEVNILFDVAIERLSFDRKFINKDIKEFILNMDDDCSYTYWSNTANKDLSGDLPLDTFEILKEIMYGYVWDNIQYLVIENKLEERNEIYDELINNFTIQEIDFGLINSDRSLLSKNQISNILKKEAINEFIKNLDSLVIVNRINKIIEEHSGINHFEEAEEILLNFGEIEWTQEFNNDKEMIKYLFSTKLLTELLYQDIYYNPHKYLDSDAILEKMKKNEIIADVRESYSSDELIEYINYLSEKASHQGGQ